MNLKDPLTAALKDLEAAGDRGARAVVRAGQKDIRAGARRQIKGAPRWNRRGRGRTGEAFTAEGFPAHSPREGGPGSLTGNLKGRVHSTVQKRSSIGWSGQVSAMGGAQSLDAGRVESKYPFMAPAVRDYEGRAPTVAYQAWALEIGRVK
jgi:hypothetical protein